MPDEVAPENPELTLAEAQPQTPASAETPAQAQTPPAAPAPIEPAAFAWPFSAGGIVLDAQKIETIMITTSEGKKYTVNGTDLDHVSMVRRGMGGKYPMPDKSATSAPAPAPQPPAPAAAPPAVPAQTNPTAPPETEELSGDARVLINKITRAELAAVPNLDLTKRTDQLSSMTVPQLTNVLAGLENPATAAPVAQPAALGAPPGAQPDLSNMTVDQVLRVGMGLPLEDPFAPPQAADNTGGGQQ